MPMLAQGNEQETIPTESMSVMHLYVHAYILVFITETHAINDLTHKVPRLVNHMDL